MMLSIATETRKDVPEKQASCFCIAEERRQETKEKGLAPRRVPSSANILCPPWVALHGVHTRWYDYKILIAVKRDIG